MFCFSVLFVRANSAAKHPIIFKKYRATSRSKWQAITFTNNFTLVRKYNKMLLFFQKKY